MKSEFYFSRSEDPFFIETEKLLRPLMDDVLARKSNASQKAIWLMCKIISEISVTLFKDSAYTTQVIEAVELYLKSKNMDGIRSIARKRKTDRLRMIRAIACDCLEYFSFLPMQLEADPKSIHWYMETMDNMLWLLRNDEPDKDCMEILKHYMKQL